MSDIQSSPALSDTQPRKVKKRRIGILIAALVVLAAIGFGGLAGYAQGVGARMNAQQTSEGRSVAEQYTLAEKAFAEKRYDLARQHLDYVIKQNQAYPGAVALLTKLMVEMAVTP